MQGWSKCMLVPEMCLYVCVCVCSEASPKLQTYLSFHFAMTIPDARGALFRPQSLP